MEIVSIKKTESYILKDVKKNIENSLKEIGGIKSIIKKTDSVLLKPNLLTARKPEDCVTTHPIVIEAVILILKEYGIKKIALGDSPALDSMFKVLKISGIEDVCKKHNIEIIEFKDEKKLVNKNNKVVKQFYLAKKAFEFNKIINLPKMKTHSFTIFTGSVKNLFGLVPGKSKLVFHAKHMDPLDFCDMLLDLNNIANPCLTIMDGIVGMEGNGPSGGEPRNFNVLLTGKNTIAIDNIACEIMGIKKVPLIISAKKRNLLGSDLKNIAIKGNSVSELKLKDVKYPKLGIIASFRGIFAILRKFIAKYPFVKTKKCISCAKCNEICPVNAISMKKDTLLKNSHINHKNIPFFDYKKCIRCYCCHEVCPVKAIGLKKPRFGFVR